MSIEMPMKMPIDMSIGNKNVSQHVSREPNLRYTTILQMKIEEHVNKNVSLELNFRYTTIHLKKIEEHVRKWALPYPGSSVFSTFTTAATTITNKEHIANNNYYNN